MINLPIRISNLLKGLTDEVSASVGAAFSTVGPILSRNEAPFFPDYTDHGIQHVEKVLKTCELMLSDEAWSVFTREDSAVLILAALAHDLGMLISIEGFRFLVDSNRTDAILTVRTDKPWHKLWREYQLDARRFDGPTLKNVTGSPEPFSRHELDPYNFTERGLRIAGEFLRRNHHRLAHEIIVCGMPSGTGILPLFSSIPSHLRDLAGLIARSHGTSMRECIDFLIERDRTCHREFRHIHPTYLMALVRLADYLDLDIERAPASILAAKSLSSPISRREWWSHRVVVDCHSLDDDPECLRIVIDPSILPDIDTFAVIEEKIAGIQQELDSAWAVLGEVYGRFPPLNKLTLKVRRIKSDLRQPQTISQLPFVPHKAVLESARSDLLKLLIKPLYGDKPGIGIRELIQNAIDAVREIEFVINKSPSLSSVVRENIGSDVEVRFELDSDGHHWTIVSDRGIGMTWETICKYYLTAGASFRQSDAWIKEFTDESGSAQVLRAGRFGIGVLASFLLGDRICVSSRHIEEPEDRGIQFEFGLDDTTIELRWVKRNVGTTIRVRTKKNVIDKLLEKSSWRREQWDWYCLDKPVLIRKDLEGKEIKPEFRLPGIEGPMPVNVHRIDIPGFQAVDWSYRKNLPSVICNGILIPMGRIDFIEEFNKRDDESSPYYSYTDSHLRLKAPKISIFDPDGRFPLNLARDRVTGSSDEFRSILADDICMNFLAFCLVNGPRSRLFLNDQFRSYATPTYPGYWDYHGYPTRHSLSPFFDARHGFGLSDEWNISHFTSLPSLLVRGDRRIEKEVNIPTINKYEKLYGMTFGVLSSGTLGDFDYWHRRLAITPLVVPGSDGLSPFCHFDIKGVRILMSHSRYARFCEKQIKFITNKHHLENKSSDWIVFTLGMCANNSFNLLRLADELARNKFYFESVSEIYFGQQTTAPKPGRIARLWDKIIGEPVIPFEEGKREKILKKIESKLENHSKEWLSE